jgi:hypothetical protein
MEYAVVYNFNNETHECGHWIDFKTKEEAEMFIEKHKDKLKNFILYVKVN